MLAIVDYGVGNLFSLKSSFAAIGVDCEVTGDEAALEDADRIVLPGVGAFGDAISRLRETGLDEVLCEQAFLGKPLLGICLGMQLLFEKSLEFGEHAGLGLIPGVVAPIRPLLPDYLKVPHIGWNALQYPGGRRHPLFQYVEEGEFVYFVHSYAAVEVGDSRIASAEYGVALTAAVARGNVMGTQFHPEKSGNTGLNILRAFAEYGKE